eukprot:gb/GECH01011450.1/.p1 GENE.gb/GECH01011450.1/~~gb/GECH01011450.1/.p1  ORF type:complete len:167 (+),score=26.55 gb/GECH01011450.1/:1-501(+)
MIMDPVSVFDVRSALNNLDFQWRPPMDTPAVDLSANKSSCEFISRALSFDPSYSKALVLSFDVFRTEPGDVMHAVEHKVHWIALLNFERKEMLLQAPGSLRNFTKESLIALMEIAEETGCEHAYVALDKNHPDFKTLSKSLMYFDFKPVNPNVRQFDHCMLLGCQL